MIYVPNYESGNCAYIYNSDVIRVYNATPQANTTRTYYDYYIKSSYIYNTGSTTFSQYTTLPSCIEPSRITTDVYYRNDFPQILFMFVVFAYISFIIPLKIFGRMFRRYL